MKTEPIRTDVWVKTIFYRSETGACLDYRVTYSGNTVQIEGPHFNITMPMPVAKSVARAIDRNA